MKWIDLLIIQCFYDTFRATATTINLLRCSNVLQSRTMSVLNSLSCWNIKKIYMSYMLYGLASIVFSGGILKVYNEFILSPGEQFYFKFVLPKVELLCTCIIWCSGYSNIAREEMWVLTLSVIIIQSWMSPWRALRNLIQCMKESRSEVKGVCQTVSLISILLYRTQNQLFLNKIKVHFLLVILISS